MRDGLGVLCGEGRGMLSGSIAKEMRLSESEESAVWHCRWSRGVWWDGLE